ncbi:hypothetical protein F0562_012019 [Nyssa sinensis]|uniref:Uncharacterized protein n=1 Tax=Nyssa sinensis TaxID=561372 RepID=A0A5J4ZR86_9ASTE|nr:hypothetical protein F0562_012019 [Nyssa sinensis]
MQGDALATNNANRLAVRSSASAAGVYSMEGLFSDGVPITYSTSAVCSRAATSNTNGLEPTVQSTLGLRDTPNAFSDAVRPIANQIGESRLNDIREGVDGAARENVSIQDTCSDHSWADRAEEGEFIPQATLDLEAEFGSFSEDPSFLMESFHGDSSSSSIRGRRSLNNGCHGGH